MDKGDWKQNETLIEIFILIMIHFWYWLKIHWCLNAFKVQDSKSIVVQKMGLICHEQTDWCIQKEMVERLKTLNKTTTKYMWSQFYFNDARCLITLLRYGSVPTSNAAQRLSFSCAILTILNNSTFALLEPLCNDIYWKGQGHQLKLMTESVNIKVLTKMCFNLPSFKKL